MSLDRPDDLDRGMAMRRAMLGDAWVERSLGQANHFNADFQSLVTRHAWQDIWCRPGLDTQTRRLLVLGMTMAAARWEEFELHCRAALRGGVPLEAVRETLMQGAIYCGVPAANTAFKITVGICQAEGIELLPAPLIGPQRVEVHHSFSLPQLRLALQGTGSAGVPLVMSHALGMGLSMWDGLAASLAADHPVLRYDHRGQGANPPVEQAYGIDALVDDAARAITEWGRGPVVFIGLSMGGLVGQGLARRYPQLLRGLVLANTTAGFDEAGAQALRERAQTVRGGGMAEVVDATLARFLSAEARFEQSELASAVRSQLLQAHAPGYAHAAEAIAQAQQADWLPALAQVPCPTLVISGEHDPGCPPEVGQALADAIPGARHTVLPAAHLSVLECPQPFAEAVRALLASLPAPAAQA